MPKLTECSRALVLVMYLRPTVPHCVLEGRKANRPAALLSSAFSAYTVGAAQGEVSAQCADRVHRDAVRPPHRVPRLHHAATQLHHAGTHHATHNGNTQHAPCSTQLQHATHAMQLAARDARCTKQDHSIKAVKGSTDSAITAAEHCSSAARLSPLSPLTHSVVRTRA